MPAQKDAQHPRQRCQTCGEPCVLFQSARCDATTDYVLLCDACHDLMRVSALLPFVDEGVQRLQQVYLEEGMERLACRRLVNGRRSA